MGIGMLKSTSEDMHALFINSLRRVSVRNEERSSNPNFAPRLFYYIQLKRSRSRLGGFACDCTDHFLISEHSKAEQ